MTQPKENNKAPITDAEEMEIHEIFGKQFRIILSKKLNRLKNTDTKLNKIRKTTHEQNGETNKEIETLKDKIDN